jgi:hypothetical protein
MWLIGVKIPTGENRNTWRTTCPASTLFNTDLTWAGNIVYEGRFRASANKSECCIAD